MRVLVTGATGFVGGFLCKELAGRGHIVRAALRTEGPTPPAVTERAVVGELRQSARWDEALRDVDAVAHLAARVHDASDMDAEAHLESNARATRGLAQAAARAGVGRLVFLSSIKVNGERTTQRPYTARDEPQPRGPYAESKWLGEQYLWEVQTATGLEVAAVRSPLVYGPGVRANFRRLLEWVDSRWPLPLGAVRNHRSLVSAWNLSDLLARLIERKGATGVWMVSDGEDLSTPDLIRRLARSMQRTPRLVPIPPALLRLGGALMGRREEVMRLCESLIVDIDDTRRQLSWSPPLSVDDALARTVAWYRSESPARVG
ncbi:MAG: NAD-dependent epimerase/dehydratase family protein [Steroidobacteraceae bacterium]|jgi:nucleoside-diphosphate-sugar epimerase